MTHVQVERAAVLVGVLLKQRHNFAETIDGLAVGGGLARALEPVGTDAETGGRALRDIAYAVDSPEVARVGYALNEGLLVAIDDRLVVRHIFIDILVETEHDLVGYRLVHAALIVALYVLNKVGILLRQYHRLERLVGAALRGVDEVYMYAGLSLHPLEEEVVVVGGEILEGDGVHPVVKLIRLVNERKLDAVVGFVAALDRSLVAGRGRRRGRRLGRRGLLALLASGEQSRYHHYGKKQCKYLFHNCPPNINSFDT